eukprot:TRINITY_DN822_c0_g1_i1.p1 TRINITY_DN822_c0_g1~~TRINITY_DN822_c0_g1_i1.p1  ORF type:complete len:229 (+),score=22.33 TRINITY_DN822_c0_g1_i1:39-689(+)
MAAPKIASNPPPVPKLVSLIISRSSHEDDDLPHLVIPNLYISSVAVACNQALLDEYKITHIVNASGIRNWFPEKCTYFKIDIMDSPRLDIKQYFAESNGFIRQALEQNKVVLVHCQAGVSRSAALVLAYLIQHNNMSMDEAIAHLRAARSCIAPNSGFLRQLREFENEVFTADPSKSRNDVASEEVAAVMAEAEFDRLIAAQPSKHADSEAKSCDS